MAKSVLSNTQRILVIGGSAGSLHIMLRILGNIRPDFGMPVVIVLHRKNDSESSLAELMAYKSRIPVKEADDKDPIEAGKAYIAPADYHLLIENEKHFSLDSSEKINFSRPSIDFTFQTAAEAYGAGTTGILLSGANADGVEGLIAIQGVNGTTIAQDPSTAQVPFMPKSAIQSLKVDHIFDVDQMIEYINQL